jgi:hypothetical protein
MELRNQAGSRRSRWGPLGSERLFFRIYLPLGLLANLCLGVVILANLHPEGWAGWLEIGTGAFCCVIAGWLAAAAWSKSYWNRTMTRQVTMWRQIADTFFAWLEEAPLPAESLTGLKSSLDKVVTTPDRPFVAAPDGSLVTTPERP